MKAALLPALFLVALSPTLASEAPEIILDRAGPEIFPETWRGGRVDAKAEPLLDSERERIRAIIDRTLANYPSDLLEATLKHVYGLGHLEYHDVATGGTRSRSSIYIVCKPTYSDTDVEGIIHAEYSSILFQKFPQYFDAEAWQKTNPPDFRYLGGGVRAVSGGKASRRFDPAMHELGFLHEYARASIEEDFNSHAARLLRGDAPYWEAVERNPKLKAKADLVMDFYAKVHAEFTEQRFEALRETGAN